MRDFAPDWERWLPRGYAGRVAVQTSQGCPFTCKFCDFRLMNRTDYKPLGVLREELRALHAIGVRKIDFVDDLFTLPEERLVEVCRMILDEGWDFDWFCLSRSSGLSEGAVRLMAEAGCTMVNVGMESADPVVLANMSKNTRVDEARRQVEAFGRHGITVFTNIILGYPGETDESIGRTIRFLNETGVHAYFLNLFQVGRGTIVDAPEYRERFALVGENELWSHRTGTSLEFAGKMSEFADQVSGAVLRLGGLEDMQMLMNGGYTRPQLAALAPLMQGLAECARTSAGAPAHAIQRSRELLDQLACLERARGSLPEDSPTKVRAGTAQAATGR